MNAPDDRLFNLLPAVYRQRDAEMGGPLQQLLQVIAAQVNAVENDISQLYDNWFIETCQDWAAPYIGDLIGYKPCNSAGRPADPLTPEGQRLGKILTPRQDVANTPRYNRRKGTLAVLEDLAAAVAGWPAHAVEFFRLSAFTQDVGRPTLRVGRTVDVRRGDALDRLGGPFDSTAHRPDVRGIASPRTRGRSNLPDVGVFIWRLRPYRVSRTSAHCLADEGLPHYYTFSVLGNAGPLFTGPGQRIDSEQPAELGVPAPIRLRAFEERVGPHSQASADYYGVGKSLAVWAGAWPRKDRKTKEDENNRPLPRQSVIPADLSGFHYSPPPNHIAVDPERGLIAFPTDQPPREHVYVSYYYGFSDALGGGEYERSVAPAPAGAVVYAVGAKPGQLRLRDALQKWAQDQPDHGIIEFEESGVHVEPISLQMTKAGQALEFRALSGARPVLRLLDWQTDQPNSFSISGAPGGRLVLDGLLVSGRGVRVEGVEEIVVRHTTLVPGWGLHPHCEPRRPAEPSLEIFAPVARVVVERSILGTIQFTHGDRPAEPVPVVLTDSILDSAGPETPAMESPGRLAANVRLTVRRCTVFGRVETHVLELAENAIFMDALRVADHQPGCVRCCYLDPCSRTPRRYRCQPDLVSGEAERRRVRPQFTSVRYGAPGYAQLASDCAPEITGGADDDSEMGVFHDLYQPQRAANLTTRLQDFTPAAMDVGIIYVT